MAPDPRFPGQPAVTLARRAGDGYNDVGLLYVASPELLAHYGLDLRAAGPATEILTVESGEIHLTGTAREPGTPPEAVDGALPLTVRYFSIPGSFITLEAVQQRGWQPVRVGWLVETSAPLTPGQLATARGLAAGGGLLIESRREEQSLAGLRSRAAAAGTLLALAVLAMTVGLIRGEAAGDLRTLAAAGATSTIRRTLTGATAGALALLGAALGIGGAYLGLAAVYLDGLGALSPVPILHLLAIAAGAPLAAAIAGWLLAGNEPPTLARPPLE
jgi:putative ABC transport system permease protein